MTLIHKKDACTTQLLRVAAAADGEEIRLSHVNLVVIFAFVSKTKQMLIPRALLSILYRPEGGVLAGIRN